MRNYNIPSKEYLINKYVKENLTLKDISRDFDCGITKIAKYLSIYNIHKRTYKEVREFNSRKKYNFTDFENGLNEKSAYILGFIFADGSLVKNRDNNKFTISFGVSIKTLPVLEYISSIIGGNIHKYRKKNYRYPQKELSTYFLSYGSKYFYNILERYGLHQNKSLTITFPTNLPDKYFSYFVRGLFDGDGCVHISNQGFIHTYIITGSKSFAYSLYEKLKIIHRDMNPPLIQHNKTYNRDYYRITFYCKKAERFLQWIYSDLEEYTFRLPYKYEIYKKYTNK